jgi:hypothetical protein
MDRFIYFNLFEVFNSKKKQREKIIRKLEWLQWKLHIGRKIPVNFPKFNGGSGWWTLSRNCLKYVVDYSNKKPGFLKSFKYTLCGCISNFRKAHAELRNPDLANWITLSHWSFI